MSTLQIATRPGEESAPTRIVAEPSSKGPGSPLPRRDAQADDDRLRWRTIEVRHLAALVAVDRQGSFRRAADQLGYVQSAVSGQIAHLERVAGVRLVERASGCSTVRLTDAGRVLLGHTNEIMSRLGAAHADVTSMASREVGTVRVAGLERFAPGRFARVLRCFRERCPRACVVLDDTDDPLARLVAGTIDLVVVDRLPSEGPFAQPVVEHDPYVLLVRAGSALAVSGQPPAASDIAALRVIIPLCAGLSDADDARLRELGIELRSSLRPESVATAQALVTAGLGAAIVSRSQFEPGDPNIAAIGISRLLPERTISLVCHSEREYPTAVHGFIRAVRLACEAERRRADAVAA